MLSIDADRFAAVVQQAFDACSNVKDAKRWQVAIVKAKQQLESNPYIHPDDDGLLILSPESLNIYHANGSCQCRAWQRGKFPCWHRAAARLVQRYAELSH